MLNELGSARTAIERAGYGAVEVRGHFRLGAAFAIGAELSRTAKFELATRQNGETWGTAGERNQVPLSVSAHDVGQGGDVAICLSISRDIADDVLSYIKTAALPVAKVLAIAPQAGPGWASLTGAADARGVAEATVLQAGKAGSPGLHVFLCTPDALALMLGHGWNRVPETQLYEDTNPGYQPTFRFGKR
jgi:hypothetical protein